MVNEYSLIKDGFFFPRKDVGSQNRIMGGPMEFSM